VDDRNRLFRSVWAYVLWLLLIGNQVWIDWRHVRLGSLPLLPLLGRWPVFQGINSLLSLLVVAFVAILIYRLTNNRLERAGLFLFVLSDALSVLLALNRLGWVAVTMPFRANAHFLLDTAVLAIIAIRIVQVIQEGPLSSAFHPVAAGRTG
jgi:hypothetical protein